MVVPHVGIVGQLDVVGQLHTTLKLVQGFLICHLRFREPWLALILQFTKCRFVVSDVALGEINHALCNEIGKRVDIVLYPDSILQERFRSGDSRPSKRIKYTISLLRVVKDVPSHNVVGSPSEVGVHAGMALCSLSVSRNW